MKMGAGPRVAEKITGFGVVPPQDNGWSLTPMQNLLGGLRNQQDRVVLELFGSDGVVSYRVRTNNAGSLAGMLQSYFPQAVVKRQETGGELTDADREDWLYLKEDEVGLVQTLGLSSEAYLPLKIFDDQTIALSMKDPLAGVIGLLGTSTRSGGEMKGERMGIRLVIKPARGDWNVVWQDKMQVRRDGEDRAVRSSGGVQAGPSVGMLLGMGTLGVVGAANWWVWSSFPGAFLVPLNIGMAGIGLGGLVGWGRVRGGKQRPYLDEELVEAKLKSLAFWAEVQIVQIFHKNEDELDVRGSMGRMVDCLRSFDDPAGNTWKEGQVRRYAGSDCQVEGKHPFMGGSQLADWIYPNKARKTALSAREVASLWHLPLGTEEMVSMERTAAGVLFPFLGDLGSEGPDSGPLVGVSGQNRDQVRLPESAIRKHAIIMGKSGVGKSTMIKHVLAHKLERKARGMDDGAVVVIDPHAELVRDVLKMVPEGIADKVRLLDFGRMDRVPGINLVDPVLFPDRDRCVDTIVGTVKHLWDHWGGRLEDLLKRSLLIIYEYNSHKDTPREEMLTMLDILALLEEGKQVGQGASARTEESGFQRHVMSRVSDPRLKEWFKAYLGWDRALRSEAVGPVHSRIGAYASNMRAAVIMGQRESTINLSDVLSEGLVLLVSTAQGTIGVGPAALMGGTMVSLVESALRDQESLAADKRAKCLLVCDEFQTVTGANWEGLLAESRKYGCSLMLATQSLARLDTPERKLKAGVLGNVGCIVGYQMSAEDAQIIAPEMDIERVEQRFLVNLHPHHCYVRINSDKKCFSAFSMETLPPPEITRTLEEIERAEEAVLSASVAYTTDWGEARTKMNSEVAERLGFVDGSDDGGAKGGEDEGGSGDKGKPSKGGAPAGGGSASPFAAAIKATVNKRVDAGSLKWIKESDIQDSNYTVEELSKFMRDSNTDTGLRAVIDKRLGDKSGKTRREVREEEIGVVREEVEKELSEKMVEEREALAAQKAYLDKVNADLEGEVLARLEGEREKLFAEAMAVARVEMAEAMVATGSGAGAAEDSAVGERRLDRVSRVALKD